MIKTLRITSVIAVLLAAVVLASVLGFLRPTSFLRLNPGTGGDKKIEKILSGPSAVDRFKEKRGTNPSDGVDTTPPLVKEATVLEGIINPSEDTGKPRSISSLPPRPIQGKPIGVMSAKFDLLGICYSPDPKTSLAYIRLPDSTYQWVGLGSEVGRLTIKEIRRNSIVCVESGRDVEMPVVAPPDTANLLEADNASATPAPSLPRPAVGAKTAASPVKPSMAASPKAAPGATLPSAQISKEEQESLSQLGDRLKSSTGAGSTERDAAGNKLISEYKPAQANPPEADKAGSPGETAAAGQDTSKDDAAKRLYLKRLSNKPRSNMK